MWKFELTPTDLSLTLVYLTVALKANIETSTLSTQNSLNQAGKKNTPQLDLGYCLEKSGYCRRRSADSTTGRQWSTEHRSPS